MGPGNHWPCPGIESRDPELSPFPQGAKQHSPHFRSLSLTIACVLGISSSSKCGSRGRERLRIWSEVTQQSPESDLTSLALKEAHLPATCSPVQWRSQKKSLTRCPERWRRSEESWCGKPCGRGGTGEISAPSGLVLAPSWDPDEDRAAILIKHWDVYQEPSTTVNSLPPPLPTSP